MNSGFGNTNTYSVRAKATMQGLTLIQAENINDEQISHEVLPGYLGLTRSLKKKRNLKTICLSRSRRENSVKKNSWKKKSRRISRRKGKR